MTDPHALDRLASAAWPAQEVAERDGWLLRLAPGVTSRRVNAAHPPPGATAVPGDVLEWYRERGAVPQVHISPAEHFSELDAVLAGEGWTHAAATDVVVADAATLRHRLGSPEHPVRRVDVDEWLEHWGRIGGHRSGEPAAAEVIRRIEGETLPLVAERDGATAGVALAVLQDGWSIVFEVAVAPEHRRHHVALALMRAWADAAGERCLQLQVDRANAPGHALYAKAGFRVSHGYHYRTAPE